MWEQALTIIAAPVIRSGMGWLQKSIGSTAKIRFNYRLLGETMIRVGLIGICEFALVAGVGSFLETNFGMKIDLGLVENLAIGASVLLTDKIIKAIKEVRNVTKR